MNLSDRIHQILGSARSHAARSVNSAQVLANWLIGREIVEEEQGGAERAAYGENLIPQLARRLKAKGVRGYAATNLRHCRSFHLVYPHLLEGEIGHTLRVQFQLADSQASERIEHTSREEFEALGRIQHASRGECPKELDESNLRIHHALRDEFKPGLFTPNLSWTHYRALLKATSPQTRAFYEIETLRHAWSARELGSLRPACLSGVLRAAVDV